MEQNNFEVDILKNVAKIANFRPKIGQLSLKRTTFFFFLMGDGLLKVQRMGTCSFHSPKVSAHKKLSAVV